MKMLKWCAAGLVAGLIAHGNPASAGPMGGFLNNPGLTPATDPVVVTGDWTFDGVLDYGTDETFGSGDTTPDVSSGSLWTSNATGVTITDFDYGAGTVSDGAMLIVRSGGATVYDCTSSNLDCNSGVDLTTAAGDVTYWVSDGTNWDMLGELDVSGRKIASDGDITLTLGDNAGVNKVIINDSGDVEVAAIDSDGAITATDLHVTHTATGDDEHAVEITSDGAGKGDIKSLEVSYTTGDTQAGDDSAVILVNIDESGASGGEVFALDVLATLNNVTVTGLKVGEGVGVFRQASGIFGDMDSFLIKAIDKLTEALSATAADLPYFLADDDTITIGDLAKFDAIEFVISTGASANGIVPVFEFWNGSIWVAFTPIDGTNGFRSTGAHIVSWDLTDISAWAVDGNTEYTIRVKRTKDNLNTTPVGSQVQIASSTIFSLDKNGNLNVNTGDFAGDVTMASGAQVITDVGSNTAPGIVISNTNTGFYSNATDTISVTVNGVLRWNLSGGLIDGANTIGPRLLNEASSTVNPTFVPDRSESGSGIGGTANNVSIIAEDVEGLRVTSTTTQITGGALNGEFLNVKSVTASAAFDSDGNTHTFTNLIPAGALVFGVGTRITETIVGATTVQVGDGADADLWGESADVAVDTTTDFSDYTSAAAVPVLYVSAQSVVITAVGGAADFSDGTMRVTAHYISNTPPAQ